MGTGATAESQGIKSDTPAPTQTELNQIVASVLANQAAAGQAQYVPPQASVYTQRLPRAYRRKCNVAVHPVSPALIFTAQFVSAL